MCKTNGKTAVKLSLIMEFDCSWITKRVKLCFIQKSCNVHVCSIYCGVYSISCDVYSIILWSMFSILLWLFYILWCTSYNYVIHIQYLVIYITKFISCDVYSINLWCIFKILCCVFYILFYCNENIFSSNL